MTGKTHQRRSPALPWRADTPRWSARRQPAAAVPAPTRPAAPTAAKMAAMATPCAPAVTRG